MPMTETRLPSLFLSHGSPMLALDAANQAHAFLKNLGDSLLTPKAILVISAHWDTAAPRITGTERPQTLHDFYGFSEPLYALRYPASGNRMLAEKVTRLLDSEAGIDPTRGLDHGAWVPLMLMYPKAEIPVVQLSLQTALGPEHHLNIGRELAALRTQGVLIIGSGGATHNLREYFHPTGDHQAYEEFSAWLHDALMRGDQEALLDYRRRAPQAERNHPTEEHLLPLFVALGAGGKRAARLHHSFDRTLCMDAYVFKD